MTSANTFDALANALLDKKRREAKAEQTITKIEWLLGLARPELGPRPIVEISAPEILTVLRTVEGRGRFETAAGFAPPSAKFSAMRCRSDGRRSTPLGRLRGALASPAVQHRAAIIEPKALGGLLRAIAGYQGTPETLAGLELLALTFVRPGESRAAEWSEFDLDAGIWSIAGERMKMRRPHRVPLAPYTLKILAGLRVITGKGKFLFPSVRTPTRCMSENTVNAALRRLGYSQDEMTGHGFRAAASSLLNESGLWHADAIERQLAHVDGDSIRRAYARGEHWAERVRMMTWWADRCDELRSDDQGFGAKMRLVCGRLKARSQCGDPLGSG